MATRLTTLACAGQLDSHVSTRLRSAVDLAEDGGVPLTGGGRPRCQRGACKWQLPCAPSARLATRHLHASGQGYCGASTYLRDAFRAFPVRGKTALVVGSIDPVIPPSPSFSVIHFVPLRPQRSTLTRWQWAESLLLAAGAAPPVTTIDYNPPISFSASVRTASVAEMRALEVRSRGAGGGRYGHGCCLLWEGFRV